MLKNIILIVILSFCAPFIYAQKMLVEYAVTKQLTVERNQLETLDFGKLKFSAFVYKDSNQYYSYTKPLYLDSLHRMTLHKQIGDKYVGVNVIKDKYTYQDYTNMDLLKTYGIFNGWLDSFQYSRPSEWELTKETKIIKGYKCFKALDYITLGNNKRLHTIAWYCPDIPFQVANNFMKFTPGLIIEAENINSNMHYELVSIKEVKEVPKEFNEIDFFKPYLLNKAQ